jgi:hypothetical protein
MANEYLNKKLPKDPVTAGKAKPEYPYVSGKSNRTGSYSIEHADPNKPYESFKESMGPDAAFEIDLIIDDKEKGVSISAKNQSTSYNYYGESSTSEAGVDKYNASTERHNTKGGTHKNVGGDSAEAVGGTIIRASAGGQSLGTVGTSVADSYIYTSGDKTIRHDGSEYVHRDKDQMTTIGGTKYEVIKDGEWGLHVQSGNWDIQVDAGKGRTYVQDELLIESPTKIIFKVGGSTITMEPNKITLVSNRIDHNP